MAKGNSNLSFVRRNILTTPEQIKSPAYKQLVRPVLEYTSAAWNSASDTATSRLEAVQRRGARLIFGIRHRSIKVTTATPDLSALISL